MHTHIMYVKKYVFLFKLHLWGHSLKYMKHIFIVVFLLISSTLNTIITSAIGLKARTWVKGMRCPGCKISGDSFCVCHASAESLPLCASASLKFAPQKLHLLSLSPCLKSTSLFFLRVRFLRWFLDWEWRHFVTLAFS